MIKEGWFNHHKEVLQLLYERDSIDASNLNSYSKNGARDSHVNLIPLTSLNYLKFAQQNFLHKKMLRKVINYG